LEEYDPCCQDLGKVALWDDIALELSDSGTYRDLYCRTRMSPTMDRKTQPPAGWDRRPRRMGRGGVLARRY
jgi:hypothetical protein